MHKEGGEDESAPVKLTRQLIRKKPLRSELNLQPHPVIKGFPVIRPKAMKIKRAIHDQPLTKADSSSDEGDFSRSSSYWSIRRVCERKLLSRRKACPSKSTTHVATKDLWSEGESGVRVRVE